MVARVARQAHGEGRRRNTRESICGRRVEANELGAIGVAKAVVGMLCFDST